MSLLKLLLAFAPWLVFLVVAHGSLLRLKVGLVIALALCVVMGVARLHRGIILWVGVVFFSYATVAVVFFENMWTAHYMGVLANCALAACTWLGVATGKPFTLDYAREHVPPALWNDPAFIRSNTLITSAWGGSFTVNAVLALGKAEQFLLSELAYELLSYAFLIATAVFTSVYTDRLRRARADAAG